MRNPLIPLLVVCSLVTPHALGQVLPAPSSEFPVSTPVLTAAPLDQSPTVADSNGDVALIAWDDSRSGASFTYVARVHEDGAVLDPLGIRIGPGVARAVVWTGEVFVLLLELPVLHELVYISDTGQILIRQQLDIEESFAGMLDGSEVRLLFLRQDRKFSGESFLRGQIVDPGFVSEPLGATPVLRNVELPVAPVDLVDNQWIAASDGTDILVLRYQRRESGGAVERIAADRLDADGAVLSSVDSGLPTALDTSDELDGNADGYVFVRHARSDSPNVRSYRLTSAGVHTGVTDVLPAPVPPPFTEIDMVRDQSGYLFTWWSPDSVQGVTRAYAAAMTTEGAFGPTHIIGEWFGSISHAALAATGGHRVAFHGVRQRLSSSSYDLYATTLTDTLEVFDRDLVSQSATLQTEVRVAASNSGYIVGWAEIGPDRFARAFVRRFSTGGLADDTVPREVYAIEQNEFALQLPQVRVAATTEAYAVVWKTPQGLFARRLAAFGGDWFDAPIQVAGSATDFDVASNGSDVQIVWTAPCAQGPLCVMSRRLSMAGGPSMTSPEVIDASGFNHEVTIASDGSDYLVAWSDRLRDCPVGCGIDPYVLRAARVAADGRPIGQPFAVEDRRALAVKPAIAFDGQDYIVAWSSWADGWSVRGVRVTRDGEVREREASGNGVRLAEGLASISSQPVLGRVGDQMLLATRYAEVIQRRTEYVWSATTFPARLPLTEVRARQRVELFRSASETFGSVHAARSPRGYLFLGYDRVAEGIYGGVPRAFVTRFGTAPSGRRRSVGR